MKESILNGLIVEQQNLVQHPLYNELTDLPRLRIFMETHVFAVWDFMSLLKSLQREITSVTVPWKPSSYPPELVRFINQIVIGEESDVNNEGEVSSHFELYLQAMEEVGASTCAIRNFLSDPQIRFIPEPARHFVEHNLRLASGGELLEIAAAFFYGREKLIPGMFQSIISILDSHNLQAPTFRYYLERHITIDGDEHGPLAEKCLLHLTQNHAGLIEKAQAAGFQALQQRTLLWDKVLEQIRSAK